MDQAGLAYARHDNCFPWIEDWARAQQLMDQQLRIDWPTVLTDMAGRLNPIHDQLFQAYPASYYWSTYQSEWAIDLTFRTADDLRRLYPRLLQQAMTTFGSTDVMRFLGRRLPLSGAIPTRFSGEVVTDLHQRQEGVRIKHRLNRNSVKLYDKAFTELKAARTERELSTIVETAKLRPLREYHLRPNAPCIAHHVITTPSTLLSARWTPLLTTFARLSASSRQREPEFR